MSVILFLLLTFGPVMILSGYLNHRDVGDGPVVVLCGLTFIGSAIGSYYLLVA